MVFKFGITNELHYWRRRNFNTKLHVIVDETTNQLYKYLAVPTIMPNCAFLGLLNVPGKNFFTKNQPLLVFKCKYKIFEITNNEKKIDSLKHGNTFCLYYFYIENKVYVKKKEYWTYLSNFVFYSVNFIFCSIFIACSKWKEDRAFFLLLLLFLLSLVLVFQALFVFFVCFLLLLLLFLLLLGFLYYFPHKASFI